jgi:hypothetical protein
MFKYFEDKDSNISVAVNSNLIICVKETNYGTTIIFNDSSYIVVKQTYLETVARLNEV